MEEPGRLQSMGSRRVGHDWVTSLSLFTSMHWRRKWQPTLEFLPGESQGWGSLLGCSLGSHRVGQDWSDLAAAAAAAGDRVGFPEHYSRFSLIIHSIHSINSVYRTHSVLNCKAGRLSEEYMAQCPSASICFVWPLGFTLLPTPQTGCMRDMNPD